MIAENQPAQPPAPVAHEDIHEYDQDFQPKRIVVIPIDGSDSADNALQFALEKLLTKEDQVILLNARKSVFVDNVWPQSPYGLPTSTDLEKIDNEYRRLSHELLRKSAKQFLDQGYHIRAISLMGNAREQIEQKVNSLKPDLVIMGARGLGAVSRFLLGSVSEHMLHHLKYPVMIVPLAVKK